MALLEGTDETAAGGAAGRSFPTPLATQRALQLILGVFWIVDAALQYQPFMFGNQFVSTYITANASGQPEPIGWLIANAGHFISPDVAVWNALFATVQLAIGVGLLFPRTVRPALVDVVLLGRRGVGLRRRSGRCPVGFSQRTQRRARIGFPLWAGRTDGLAHRPSIER